MKISLVLVLLLAPGIMFSPMAGYGQMLQSIPDGEYREGSAPYSAQSHGSGGMIGPGQLERNTPDGGQSILHFAYTSPQVPLNKSRASQEVESYLKSTGNPNLKLGEVREKGENFEADILTKTGSLVDKILVNMHTGEMRSEY